MFASELVIYAIFVQKPGEMALEDFSNQVSCYELGILRGCHQIPGDNYFKSGKRGHMLDLISYENKYRLIRG